MTRKSDDMSREKYDKQETTQRAQTSAKADNSRNILGAWRHLVTKHEIHYVSFIL